jgi:tetratricopeptide (TPR) repeat protein
MKILHWMSTKLSRRAGRGKPASALHDLLREAQTQLNIEEYDQARAILLQALRFRNECPDTATIDYILMSLGTTWLMQERYQEEIAFFTDHINHHSGDWAAHRERAAALWYSGRLQEAISDYSRALELNPTDILSLSGRGQVLAEIGQNEKAMEDLDFALRTLKTVPTSDPSWDEWYKHIRAFVHNGRGAALGGLGKIGAATDEFEVSIALSPENAWVYYNRAQVHDLTGNAEKASSDYQMALAKTGPSLNPIRKEQAQAWLRDRPNPARSHP